MNTAFAITALFLLSFAIANGKQLQRRQSDTNVCYEALHEKCLPLIVEYAVLSSPDEFIEKIRTDEWSDTCETFQEFLDCVTETITAEGCPVKTKELKQLKTIKRILNYLCVEKFEIVDDLIPCLTGQPLLSDVESCARLNHGQRCPKRRLDCIRSKVSTRCSEEGGEIFDYVRNEVIEFEEAECFEPLMLNWKSLFKFF